MAPHLNFRTLSLLVAGFLILSFTLKFCLKAPVIHVAPSFSPSPILTTQNSDLKLSATVPSPSAPLLVKTQVSTLEELDPPSLERVQKELTDNPHQTLTPSMQHFIKRMAHSMELALQNQAEAQTFIITLQACISKTQHPSTRSLCKKNLERLLRAFPDQNTN